MKRPILIITLGFILGIILGLYLNIAPLVLGIIAFIVLVFKLIPIKNTNNYIKILNIYLKNNIIILFFITSIISSIYVIGYNNKYKKFYNEFNNTNIIVTIMSNKTETDYKNIYKVSVVNPKEFKDINLILRVSKSKNIKLNYGDTIKITGKYIVPEQARNYGGFNYKEYLKTKKVYGIFEVDNVEILKHNNLSFIELFSNKIKVNIIQKFRKIMPNNTSELFLGILIGYDDNISEEIEESFRKSSLTHLLAVSGAHIVYIITGVSFLFRKIKMPIRITSIATVIFLIFFMYITDFSSSVVRAAIMGIILLLSLLLYRKNDIKTTISISILLILLENPYKILDIGLLLSYFATIGIICFSKLSAINKSELNIKEKVIKYLKDMVLITISANIFVIPIMVYNFNTISLTFIISNVIAGILIGPITILGFILLIISFISIKLTYIIGIVYNLLLELLIYITNLTSLIPLSEIIVPTPSIIIVISYYVTLFFCVLYMFFKKEYSNRYLIKKITKYILKSFEFKKNIYKIIIIYSVFFFIIINLILKIIPKDLKIYFIDVGQGDSSLIITPTNKKILIDSGGSENGKFDVGKNTLLPYLLDRKITSLDYICISHFDSDHCDGFKYLLNNIKIKNIIFSKQHESTENFEDIISIAKRKKINILNVEAGNVLKIDKYVKFKIFSPGKVLTNDINDNSIVMKLEYNNFSCLFTGDISKQIEKNLLKKYGEELKSTVLKVSHHGSKTSSDEEFINLVNPKISLIGVGKNNKFGHPNVTVLQNLKNSNSKIFRTDRDGEIIIKINKANYIDIRTKIKFEKYRHYKNFLIQ